MRIARLNRWPLRDVMMLDSAELALAEDEAKLAFWGPVEEMLALLVEKVSDLYVLTWQAAQSKPGKKPPETVRISRPDEEEEEAPRVSWGEFAGMMRAEGWA